MSHSHNEEMPKNIQDQVKQLLSNMGEFLPQPDPATSNPDGVQNWGQLLQIVTAFKCRDCSSMHFVGFTPDGFIKTFAGTDAKNFFENFSAIGIFHSEQRPVDVSDIDRLLKKAEELEKANEEVRNHMVYVQSLNDEANIKNSHLQVEVNVLRRELNRALTGREQELPGETALDLPPLKRRWKFGLAKIRLIGGEGQQ